MINFRNNKQKEQKAEVPDHFFRDVDIEFLIHELKSPLSIIETGMRTLLKRENKFGKLSDKQKKTIKRSLRNTVKAREMIYTLLEIGRSEADSFELNEFIPGEIIFSSVFDSLETVSGEIFNEILLLKNRKDVLDLLEQNGVFLKISLPAGEQKIYQDQIKLRQITGNLIKNALYYKKKAIEIKVDIKDQFLIIEVADDGPGIAPENHKAIFERYRQIKTDVLANRSGHGLGLAGSYIMAKRLKGDIEIISQEKKGALFRLTLPVK